MKYMKRTVALSLLIIFALSVFTGCFDTTSLAPAGECTVSFNINGDVYNTELVLLGGLATTPIAPEREGYIFAGWYLDPEFKLPYDFSTPVLLSLTLYGKFVPDAAEVTRTINESVMSSIVTIENKCSNVIGGFVETESATYQGSGVVIDISGGYCYVLTNCHVVQANESYSRQKITVEDAWGNSYEATLYKHPKKTESAISEKYDLALICFPYTTNKGLTEITIGDDAKIGEYIVSVGTPEGMKNTTVFGRILDYHNLSEDDEDFKEMDFDVLVHEGALGHGSSGGAVINMKGELVGINFAGVENDVYGFAIPSSVVHEFLNIYVYN